MALTTAVSWTASAGALGALGRAFDLELTTWEYVDLLAYLDVAAAQAKAYTLALHAMLVMSVTLAGLLLLWCQPERLGLGHTTQRSTQSDPDGGPAPTPATRRRLIRSAFCAQRATGIAHTDGAEEMERAA